MAYGFCPICGSKVISRERRPNGNDKCEKGHSYPTSKTKGISPGVVIKASRKVFKYPIPTSKYGVFDINKLFVIEMRSETTPIFRMFNEQDGSLFVWFEITENPMITYNRLFKVPLFIASTGHEVPDYAKHLQSMIEINSGLVWHLYRGEIHE